MPNPANNKPDARQIATKWLDQSNGYERYFFKNVQHAIRTHDDHSIWSTIKTDNPSWLNSEDYKDAVEQLKFEVL